MNNDDKDTDFLNSEFNRKIFTRVTMLWMNNILDFYLNSDEKGLLDYKTFLKLKEDACDELIKIDNK